MAWQRYNANPEDKRVGDCTVRAISTALGISWECAYAGLAAMGFMMRDVMSADHVWGQFIRLRGFRRHVVPCRDEPCTVEDFCAEHPEGTYLLAIPGHVVCAIDGDWYDTFDSGSEYPIYYWTKEEV